MWCLVHKLTKPILAEAVSSEDVFVLAVQIRQAARPCSVANNQAVLLYTVVQPGAAAS